MNKHQSNDVFWRHKFKHSWQHTTLALTSGHNEIQWYLKPSHNLISWQYWIKQTTQIRLLCVHNWQENPFCIIRTFFRFVTACSEVDFNLVLECKIFSKFFHDIFKHISNPYCNLWVSLLFFWGISDSQKMFLPYLVNSFYVIVLHFHILAVWIHD